MAATMTGRVREMVRKALSLIRPVTKKYKIGNFTITLNNQHMLPNYQEAHRLYDRFLPVLCRHLDHTERWIIDVGANVGDSTIAMAQACQNPILSIEGDEAFFQLLTANVESFPNGKERSKAVNVLVGTGKFSGNLVSSGTTATRSDKDIGGASVSLDALLRRSGIDPNSVALLKVDTDGYDGDVILSSLQLLATAAPVLFWENQFSSEQQLGCLEEFYRSIAHLGYGKFWVFDNFGNVLLEECSLKEIADLNKYVMARNSYRATRTIHYIDVLASTEKNLGIVRAAIGLYRTETIEGRSDRL